MAEPKVGRESPGVGVGVRILRYNNALENYEVLFGLRNGAHGAGTWSFPGGELDFGESFEECAIREVEEETGLEIKAGFILGVTNDVFLEENLHYTTVFVDAIYEGGEPIVREPEKCSGWEWYQKDTLPDNLFLPIRNFMAGGYGLFER
ncbi:NUDIX domain-containing protein [archaeon]|jgi:8-oxo-dGTP diphosphatase|nr:NUDIX domain-containing protein [archaeon]MBT6182620.1 NUDIX domain-containing protein [archaeon]MBT6606220.1 NUDIX domain-containing protein [archaeon]MBT7251611.1 NUDIX domain-containing protein [archaeon]MBT7660852.1 NUDIX domain-containing protein [archaeon]